MEGKMGDTGDTYNAMRAEGQVKRSSNREKSPLYLEKHGIHFESKNNGAHLIVEGNDGYIDFWPGTGRWKARQGESGFGVRNLVKHIESQG
jgi:hypothetical protein